MSAIVQASPRPSACRPAGDDIADLAERALAANSGQAGRACRGVGIAVEDHGGTDEKRWRTSGSSSAWELTRPVSRHPLTRRSVDDAWPASRTLIFLYREPILLEMDRKRRRIFITSCAACLCTRSPIISGFQRRRHRVHDRARDWTDASCPDPCPHPQGSKVHHRMQDTEKGNNDVSARSVLIAAFSVSRCLLGELLLSWPWIKHPDPIRGNPRPAPTAHTCSARRRRLSLLATRRAIPTGEIFGTVNNFGGWYQCEISSSASPRVRGPKPPIEITTTSIAALIKPNTPPDPKFCRKNAMMKLVKIVDSRLNE